MSFKLFDANGDGFITYDEFHKIIATHTKEVHCDSETLGSMHNMHNFASSHGNLFIFF